MLYGFARKLDVICWLRHFFFFHQFPIRSFEVAGFGRLIRTELCSGSVRLNQLRWRHDMKNRKETKRSKFKVLPTADPQSVFGDFSPKEIQLLYGRPRYLLSSSSKTRKSESVGVLNRVLYLTSGVLCPAATPECRRLCLGHTSGRMSQFQSARARDRRTALYFEDQDRFLDILFDDLHDLVLEAKECEMTPAVRLNGSSDIVWERLHVHLFAEFKNTPLEFYDYTKLLPRYRHFLAGEFDGKPWPENYHLTFSMGEAVRDEVAISLLEAGGNVATVFWPHLPESWHGFEVVNGHKHDARYLDPPGTVVGLLAKSRAAENDESGFVVQLGQHRNLMNAA